MKEYFEPFVLDFNAHYDRPYELQDAIFYAMKPGQTAITARWPAAESIAQRGATFRSLTFKAGKYEWANLIDLENGWNIVIDDVNGYSGTEGFFQNGIILRGQCMDVKMSQLHLVHPVTGVLVTGESEGFSIVQSDILGAIYGVVASTPQGEALAMISDTHMSVARAGIVLVNRPQAKLHDLLIYRHTWRAGEAWDGVYVGPGSDHCNIHDVDFRGFGHPIRQVTVEAQNVIVHDVREF